MKEIIKISLASLLLVACGSEAPAPEATEDTSASMASEMEAPKYPAEIFYNSTSFLAPNVAGLAFSPNGENVIIASDETGIFNVFAVNVASGDRIQMTNSITTATYAISYFPGDNRLLYSTDGGGDELSHLYVREEDGATRDLTATEKTQAIFMGWSEDKSKFHVLTNERDQRSFDLYAYNADDYARKLLWENTNSLAVSDLREDGRYAAVVEATSSGNSDVFLLDLNIEGGAPKLLTEHDGKIQFGSYGFTPDGGKLILSTDEHGEFSQAWTYDIVSGEKAEYAKADWDIQFLGFSNTGKFQTLGINADAETKLTITNQMTGETVSLDGLAAGNVLNPRFNEDDTKLAFMLNSDVSPNDLYVADLSNGSTKRLTHAINPAINQDHLVTASVVRYESFDGTKIPSILYKPKGASLTNKVPAMVLVHGGPGGQTRKGYQAMVQHMVNHGYAILGANNRGSSGYGKTFFHMDDKDHGGGDLQDIVNGRKYLETLDWVDTSKIGIIGGSYGGYMVTAALAFEPEAFDVGVDIFGVTNWVRTLKSIPPSWESFRKSLYDEMGDPAVDAERHMAISPLFHAENIVKPLLVIQGVNDPRVLQVESDEIVEKVKANGVPVEYILFPGEGHGFRKRENRIIASDSYVNFLNRYLKGEIADEPQS